MKKITLLLSLFMSLFMSSQTLEQSFILDFGPTGGTNGAITTNPDANGNYWNNITSGDESTLVDIINTNNISTNFKIGVTDNFIVNTSVNYGPTSTDASQLGDLSITTAVQDYFYLDAGGNTSGQLTFQDLDVNKGYKFYVFASRPTTSIRATDYTFSGADAFYDVYQTSDGGTGNTNTILTTQILRPNSRGKISINLSINEGGFAYINALKFEEYSNLPIITETLEQSFIVDFGPTGGNKGAITPSPDANGNYWNNATNAALSTVINIVNTSNTASNLTMEVTDDFQINNSDNYGPTSTDSSQLGDLSITTAVQDYFYLEQTNPTGQLTFKNLDLTKKYKFYVFASRPTSSSRISNYMFSGLQTFKSTYRSSDGGTGNTDVILETPTISPTGSGEITIDLSIYGGNFAYINALKIEEYSGDPIVELVSINVTGSDIIQSGETSQMNVEFTPNDATYQDVVWSVDNENIATINTNGLLIPISNGTLTVTAKSKQNPLIFDTQEITISNQITELYFSGTATENGDNITTALPMHMVRGLEKSVTNIFEIYTSLTENGTFKFYTSKDSETAIVYGQGISSGELQINNTDIDPVESGPVLITVNLNDNTYTIVPINWSVVGSAIVNGWSGDEPLIYQGGGIWSNTINFLTTTNGDDSGRLTFRANQNWDYEMNKIANTSNVILKSQSEQYGVPRQDININYGEFIFTLNLTNYTYNIECVEIDDVKISFMGSSVAVGQGATNFEGYAYQYNQLLKQRNIEGHSGFYRSNISIGGNNTINVLNRYEKDLIGDCSKYVVYGLSLGNEGVHENGQSAFDQFKENLELLIEKAVDDGKTPVIMNNYPRADYNNSDYNFVKQMNLLIGQWDIPSVNFLGAIDDGAGRWASGYQNDVYHPNDAGHAEFMYAIVPSLFDALELNKPAPVFTDATSITMNNLSTGFLKFTPENIVHPFTISLDFKTNNSGQIISFKTDAALSGNVILDGNGNLKYTSPLGSSILDNVKINDNKWHNVTLTHFYARGETLLYRDAVFIGSISENLEIDDFNIHDVSLAPSDVSYKNWLFYRSGMNEMEINLLYNKVLLKSSLELYAPLDENAVLSSDPYVNLAQSTNTIDATNFTLDTKKNNYQNGIKIYPNPIKEKLNVKTTNNENIKSISVFGITGNLLKIVTATNNIDFSTFSSGLYFIKVKTSTDLYTFKIVKE